MDLQLKGKKAIVTGGGRGIGKSISRLLAEEGVSVAICGRSANTLNETIADFGEAGLNIVGKPVDVGDRHAYIDWLHWAVESMEGMDIFVHNVTSGVESGELEDWEQAYNIDLMGAVIACETLQPVLERSSSASIVLISSISALVVRTGNRPDHAYGAMKAALINYAGQLSKMLGPKGIRVNVVSPGSIDFPGSAWERTKHEDPEYYRSIAEATPLGRLGTPEEIAYAVAMVASPRASLINGANLIADGGYSSHVDF